MANYVNSPLELMYKLSAVLCHQGRDSNSGHYVAKIYNEAQGKWYNYDDEIVTELNQLTFENTKLNEPNASGSSSTTNILDELSKSFVSNNAYVLIYKRDDSSKVLESTSAPAYLSDLVMAENVVFEEEIRQENQKLNLIKEYYRFKSEAWNEVMKVWEAGPYNAVYVPTERLMEAIDSDFSGIYKPNNKIGHSETFVIDCDELVCSHGKLDPEKVWFGKRISENGIKLMESKCNIEIRPKLTQPDCFCEDCALGLFNARREIELHYLDYKVLKNELKIKEDTNQYCISKEWFNSWKKKTPLFENSIIPRPDSQPYHDHIFCKHGKPNLKNKDLWVSIPESVLIIVY